MKPILAILAAAAIAVALLLERVTRLPDVDWYDDSDDAGDYGALPVTFGQQYITHWRFHGTTPDVEWTRLSEVSA